MRRLGRGPNPSLDPTRAPTPRWTSASRTCTRCARCTATTPWWPRCGPFTATLRSPAPPLLSIPQPQSCGSACPFSPHLPDLVLQSEAHRFVLVACALLPAPPSCLPACRPRTSSTATRRTCRSSPRWPTPPCSRTTGHRCARLVGGQECGHTAGRKRTLAPTAWVPAPMLAPTLTSSKPRQLGRLKLCACMCPHAGLWHAGRAARARPRRQRLRAHFVGPAQQDGGAPRRHALRPNAVSALRPSGVGSVTTQRAAEAGVTLRSPQASPKLTPEP